VGRNYRGDEVTVDLKKGLARFWHEWLKSLLIVVLVVGGFRSTFADWNDVPSGSMKPTILEGDRIFVNKLAYDLKVPFTRWRVVRWASPNRGDIAVLFSPADGKRLVKRVVGLPGDTLAMADDRLYVNGKAAYYRPLPPVRDLDPSVDAYPRVLAVEDVGGATHPVMLTPTLPAMRNFGPIVVPPGCFFVMGDNRAESGDSRYFGFVERDRIVGRVTAVAASVDPGRHYRPRWHRFFKPLP
jgi:signal peptidase I